jgi:hypothetical protein
VYWFDVGAVSLLHGTSDAASGLHVSLRYSSADFVRLRLSVALLLHRTTQRRQILVACCCSDHYAPMNEHDMQACATL